MNIHLVNLVNTHFSCTKLLIVEYEFWISCEIVQRRAGEILSIERIIKFGRNMEFFSLLELNDFDENKIVDFKIKLSKEGSMKY